MNNSISIESALEEIPPERTEWMRAREGTLVKIIESLGRLSVTDEWSTLKTEVFNGVVENLEKRLVSESSKMPLDTGKIYQLQGQLVWARRYANLDTLTDTFRLELTNIRNQLKPPGLSG